MVNRFNTSRGLNDLINAETEAQFQSSIRQYNGFLSDKIENWRHELYHYLQN